jgi:hypothetical protein
VLNGEGLRSRLGALARSRRLEQRADDPREFTAGHVGENAELLGVEEYLPGGEWRDKRGTVWVHERLRSTIDKPKKHWGQLDPPEGDEPDLRAVAELGLKHALFLDLETGGLASSPVFLAGTMHWNGEDFVLRQYFARHYGEEATLVGALHEAARDFEYLVTFNGKSYDAPFLRGRALVHGVPLRLPPRHLDLPAKRYPGSITTSCAAVMPTAWCPSSTTICWTSPRWRRSCVLCAGMAEGSVARRSRASSWSNPCQTHPGCRSRWITEMVRSCAVLTPRFAAPI